MTDEKPVKRCRWYISPLQEECGKAAIGTFEFEGLNSQLSRIDLCREHYTHTKNRWRAIQRRRDNLKRGA